MNRKHYILGTLALLCLLGTGYYAWILYDAHRKQVAEWNEGAKAAFEEALWMEVNKRAEVPIYSSSSGESGITTLKERVPDSVFVTSALGRKGYRIERYKYDNSLIKEMAKRARLSTLLQKRPLSMDSLTIHWNNLLSEKQIPVSNQLRYIYTDLVLQNDTSFSVVKERFFRLDSLTVKYLGFRCEHELTAFVSYPYWLLNLSWNVWGGLLFPWALFAILLVFYTPIESFIKRRFVEEKIVEKEIHVADVAIDKAKVFQLPDGCLFDSFAGTLTKGEMSKQLPPQSALLLKLFLRKENHRLSPTEIEQELWNRNSSTDQLRQAIQRLRRELKTISSEIVIKNVNGDYELKLPISSNNSVETDD